MLKMEAFTSDFEAWEFSSTWIFFFLHNFWFSLGRLSFDRRTNLSLKSELAILGCAFSFPDLWVGKTVVLFHYFFFLIRFTCSFLLFACYVALISFDYSPTHVTDTLFGGYCV